MSVVHRKEFLRRMALPISDAESFVITPLMEKKGKKHDPDSIDLRLGSFFLLPQVPPEPFIVPSKSYAGRSHFRVHIPIGRFLALPAHHTVLGATLEFIKLPHDLSGEILTKSSIARTFIIIETAPWIHPLYRGCLTLEIANVSNTPLLLYPGRPIGQLVLMDIFPRPSVALADGETTKLAGSYLGPVYPEAPILPDPAEDLKSIGVPESEIRLPVKFDFPSTATNAVKRDASKKIDASKSKNAKKSKSANKRTRR